MKNRMNLGMKAVLLLWFSLLLSPDSLLGKVKAVPDTGAVATEFSIDESGIKIRTRGQGLDEEEKGEISVELGEGHDIVKMGHNITVPRGKKVRGSVVAIGGSISIFGEVLGDAVAIGGGVSVDSGGIVSGDAVSIGGAVTEGPEATIRGESVSLGFLPSALWKGESFKWILGFLPFVGDATASFRPAWSVVVKLVKLLVYLLFGAVMVLLFRERIGKIASAFSGKFFQSFAIGFVIMILLFPLFLITFILLCISIIGIPLAIAYPFVLMFLLFMGYVSGAFVIGRRVSPGFGPVEATLLGIFLIHLVGIVGSLLSLAGGVFWALGLSLGILGMVIGTLVTTAGIGAIAYSRLGRGKGEGVKEEAATSPVQA